MSSLSASPALDAPTPRLRRTKIIAFISFVLIGALLSLRAIWGVMAQRRLAAEMEWAKRDGMPAAVHPAEDADPQNNAVPLIIEAIKAQDATLDSPAASNLEYPGYPPFPPQWHQLADAAVAGNVKTLALLRQSRQRRSFGWDSYFGVGTPRTTPGSLSSIRNLANLTGDAALHAHIHGDDALALERIQDVLHLSDATDRQDTFIGHLVATGVDALAMHRLEVMTPALKIPANDQSSPVRRSVRVLIARLMDETREGESLRRAIAGESPQFVNEMKKHTDESWLLGPMYELDLARVMRGQRTRMTAAEQRTYPAMKALVEPVNVVTGPHDPPRFAAMISRIWTPALDRVFEIDMRIRMEHRLAAAALAVQLYRADHGGAWPASLEELVPKYLPRVPADPFAADGRAIGYQTIRKGLPDGTDRIVVISVGPDGKDDGAARVIPPEPQYGWLATRGAAPDDQYRDLQRWAPPPPATAPDGAPLQQ